MSSRATGRYFITGVAIAKSVCSRFTIENYNDFEISKLVDTLREISKNYSMSDLLYHLCTHSCNTPSGTFLNRNYCEVEDLVELDTFDIKWTGNVGCSTRYTF